MRKGDRGLKRPFTIARHSLYSSRWATVGSKRKARSAGSGRHAAAVRRGPIGEGLREVDPAHTLLAVEVGQRAGDLQDPVEAPGGQTHRVGRVADQGEPVGVRAGDLFEERGRAGG